MAAMFSEMAEVARGYALHENRGSFFEDFEVFIFVRAVWEELIRRRMPRPDDELLADVSRRWDAVKAGAPETSAQMAAREWLVRHTAASKTLVDILAESYREAARQAAGTDQQARDTPAEETAPSSARDGDHPVTGGPLFGWGYPADLFGYLGTGATPPPHHAPPGLFSSGGIWPLASVVRAMEGLVPSKGSVHAAAGEISRLAQLLADATESATASDSAVPPTASAESIAGAGFNSG
jgi:hypothetical protein